MKRRATFALLSIATIAITLSGCVMRIADFTLMSTKNVNIGEKYVKVGRFDSDDLAWIILVIPTGQANIKTAVDNLLEQNGGELATDVVLSSKWLPLVLVTQVGYKVTGDVWKRASMGDLQNGTELYDLATGPDGRQRLYSTSNPAQSYVVSTEADVESQIASLQR